MVNPLVFISALVGGSITYLSTPWLIRFLRRVGLVVKDQNKKGKPPVTLSGGFAVFSGFFVGLMFFIFLRTFFPGPSTYIMGFDDHELVLLFAGMISIFLVTVIGFLDDLVVKRGAEASAGLRQWQKPLLTLNAAIPLMVVNAGTSSMYLPFFGNVHFGILYPLLFVPLGVVGAANMVNLLAGLNGLEVGMGIIYFFSLGLYAYVHHSHIAALIALMAFTSLIAFYFFNKYPAKIIPGDSLTYFLGGTLACIAILGNMEKAALIVSIPFIIEFILKARSKFRAQSYGYWKDNTIHTDSKKIYSLTHIFLRTGKYTERQIVYFLLCITVFFSALIWVV